MQIRTEDLRDLDTASPETLGLEDGQLRDLERLRGGYDERDLAGMVAYHRETWHAISAVKKDGRYSEYIDNLSEIELAGGVHMDAVLDRAEARGKARGEARGEARGKNIVNQLALLLSRDGRMDDFVKSAQDESYQRQLFKEYGLEGETDESSH